MKNCECENIVHFEDGIPERLSQRYQAHLYADRVAEVEIETEFGKFQLCKECDARCFA